MLTSFKTTSFGAVVPFHYSLILPKSEGIKKRVNLPCKAAEICTSFPTLKTIPQISERKTLQHWLPLKSNLVKLFNLKNEAFLSKPVRKHLSKNSYHIETSPIDLHCKMCFQTEDNMLLIEIILGWRNPVTCKREILLWYQLTAQLLSQRASS